MTAPRKCSETPRIVAEYLGSGSDPAEAGAAARHIADCPVCRAEVEDLEPVTGRLMQWQEQPVPEWDRRAVDDRARRGGLPDWRWIPLAASLVLALAVVFNTELRSTGDGWSVSFGAGGAAQVQEQRTARPDRAVAVLESAVRDAFQPESATSASGLHAASVRGVHLDGQGVLLEVRVQEGQSPGTGRVGEEMVLRPDQDATRRSLALSLRENASSPEAPATGDAAAEQADRDAVRGLEQRLYSALCHSGQALPLRDEEYLTVWLRDPDSSSPGSAPAGRVHVVPAAALRQCRADDGGVAGLEAAARQYDF